MVGPGVSSLYLNFGAGTLSANYTGPGFKIGVVPSGSGGHVFSYVLTGIGYSYVEAKVSSGNYTPVKLGSGDAVSNLGPNLAIFSTATGGVIPDWQNVTGGFFGVDIYLGTKTYNGWIEIDTNADASVIKIDAFGYNHTPGAASFAGAGLPAPVPEPASAAALLAAGAAGIALYRQRRGKVRAVVAA